MVYIINMVFDTNKNENKSRDLLTVGELFIKITILSVSQLNPNTT